MANKKPLILVTNDDGITAPGIRALISVMKDIGNVVVVAPDSPQSAMGHAITINDTLYCDPVKMTEDADHKEYSCSGTPADCVKLATQEILHRKPDLCVSGVNHGSNSSINVIYSGTMSAAVEAGVEGIPAIGFSLLDYSLVEDFDKRKSPQGRDYYWLTGEFINEDKGEDTDEWALSNGYVSVVPVQFDLTAHHFIQDLNSWELND